MNRINTCGSRLNINIPIRSIWWCPRKIRTHTNWITSNEECCIHPVRKFLKRAKSGINIRNPECAKKGVPLIKDGKNWIVPCNWLYSKLDQTLCVFCFNMFPQCLHSKNYIGCFIINLFRFCFLKYYFSTPNVTSMGSF